MRRPLTVGAVIVAACSSPPTQPGIPAVLDNPDDAVRRELVEVVSTALDGRSVTIAPEALTTSSWLIIEQSPSRSIDRPVEPGRDPGHPERFRLVLDGGRCFLVHERTELSWMLRFARCRAE